MLDSQATSTASLAPVSMTIEQHAPTLKDWNADLLAKRDLA
jgi:hypothetical protein